MPRARRNTSSTPSTVILRYEDRSLLIKREPNYSKAIRNIQLALRRSFNKIPSSKISLHAKVSGYGDQVHKITEPVWSDVVCKVHDITVKIHHTNGPKPGTISYLYQGRTRAIAQCSAIVDPDEVLDLTVDDDVPNPPPVPQENPVDSTIVDEGPSRTNCIIIDTGTTSHKSQVAPCKATKSDKTKPYPDLDLHSKVEEIYLSQRQRSQPHFIPWVTPPKRFHPLIRAYLQNPNPQPPAASSDADADDARALSWATRYHAHLKVDNRALVAPGRDLHAAMLEAHDRHRGINATYLAAGDKYVGISFDFVNQWVKRCPTCRDRKHGPNKSLTA